MGRVASTGLLVLALGVPRVPGQAQPDTTARIVGSVRSSINGLPISGVPITIRGTRVLSVSDSGGVFTLAELPAGRQTIRILYPDSLAHDQRDTVAYDQDLTLHPGKTLRLSVLLDLDAKMLAPVVVEENTARAERSLAGFFERQKKGLGKFYTLADLAQLKGASLQTMLTQAGVTMRCRLRRCLPLVYREGQLCLMSLFVNGLRVATDYLDAVRVEDLAAAEVYVHPFDVPTRFRIGFGREDCGAVLLWMRN